MEGADAEPADAPELDDSAPANTAAQAPAQRSPAAPALSRKESAGKCQVTGCAADLTSAKSYMRRYRVCDVHMKAEQVRPLCVRRLQRARSVGRAVPWLRVTSLSPSAGPDTLSLSRR